MRARVEKRSVLGWNKSVGAGQTNVDLSVAESEYVVEEGTGTLY